MIYSPGQIRAIDACLDAKGFVFVTGKAGTGKSTVAAELSRRGMNLLRLAPSGIAALNIGGVTIHSGLKIKTGPVRRGDTKSLQDPRILEWAHAILIDEISMVRADLMDAISWTCQKTLGSDLPFGGKPIIAMGDMWQLPPVVKGDEDVKLIRDEYAGCPYWFGAKVFGNGLGLDVTTHELTDVFRQSDPGFLDALNLVRVGDARGLRVLNERVAPVPEDGVILALTNKHADAENHARLGTLPGESAHYYCDRSGKFEHVKPAPETLELKVGAAVLVVKNTQTPEGPYLANGTRAVVTTLGPNWVEIMIASGETVRLNAATWEQKDYAFDIEIEETVETVVGSYKQIPLKLGWAITVHKSQGMTLDQAHLSMEYPAWTHGQVYVALSRVRGLDGLTLGRELTARDLKVDREIRDRFGAVTPVLEFDLEAMAI